jgi:hypothetical protein
MRVLACLAASEVEVVVRAVVVVPRVTAVVVIVMMRIMIVIVGVMVRIVVMIMGVLVRLVVLIMGVVMRIVVMIMRMAVRAVGRGGNVQALGDAGQIGVKGLFFRAVGNHFHVRSKNAVLHGLFRSKLSYSQAVHRLKKLRLVIQKLVKRGHKHVA